jgi:hypothetical protein
VVVVLGPPRGSRECYQSLFQIEQTPFLASPKVFVQGAKASSRGPNRHEKWIQYCRAIPLASPYSSRDGMTLVIRNCYAYTELPVETPVFGL